MLVSSDGQITPGTTLPLNCDGCCVVQQPDGKILQLGKYIIEKFQNLVVAQVKYCIIS
jgi:hypothetical protein